MNRKSFTKNEPITTEMLDMFVQEGQIFNSGDVSTDGQREILSKSYAESLLNGKVNLGQIITVTGDDIYIMSKDKTMLELNQKVNKNQIVSVANPNNDGSNEVMSREYAQSELDKKVDWANVKKMDTGDTNKILSESMVIDKLNKKVDWIDVKKMDTGDTNKILSESMVIDELKKKADKFPTTVNGVNYYLGQVCSATVSSGTHVFTNCWGSVTVSGSTAKVYVVNSPMLTVNGKTASNWRNICVNSVFEYQAVNAESTITSSEVTKANFGSFISMKDTIHINLYLQGYGFVTHSVAYYGNANYDYFNHMMNGYVGIGLSSGSVKLSNKTNTTCVLRSIWITSRN